MSLGLWALCLGVACSRVPPLEHTHQSPEALAQAVLKAFESGDHAQIAGVALNEREFRDHVWPELPASRPERNLSFAYVWGDLRQKSEHSLEQALAEHGGRRYTLASVRFGRTTPYDSYVVHRDTVLTVRTSGGDEFDVRLFGSMIEKNGRWKVFSYVVD